MIQETAAVKWDNQDGVEKTATLDVKWMSPC